MATITRGQTFTSTVTAQMLHDLVDKAAVSGIQTADIVNLAVTPAKLSCGAGALKKIVFRETPVVALSVSGGADAGWTDLNLQSQTSSAASAMMLKGFFRDSGAVGQYMKFRKNGVAWSEAESFGVSNLSTTVPTEFYFTVPCDSGQVVEYLVNASATNTAHYTVYVVGYMEDF